MHISSLIWGLCTYPSFQLNKEWFPPAEASGRRDYIKNILYRIFNDNVQTDPLITNDYDSSCKEIDGGSSKELLCGASSRRDLINCSTPNVDKNIQRASRETTSETNLQQFGGLHLAPGDSLDQGDAGRSSPEGTYQHCRQSELLKRFCNTLSPIEVIDIKGYFFYFQLKIYIMHPKTSNPNIVCIDRS